MLYERVVLRAPSRSLAHPATVQFPKRQLVNTKYLCLEAPPVDLLNDQCLHDWRIEDEYVQHAKDEDCKVPFTNQDPFFQLGEDVKNLCVHIPRDQLLEFEYFLPRRILPLPPC